MTVLDIVRDKIADHLNELRRLFKPGVKVTILVRHPSHPDGSRDFVLTDDLLDEVVAAILRRKHDAPPLAPRPESAAGRSETPSRD